MKPELSKTWSVRKRSDLPFYCKPVGLFLTLWVVMLLSFQMHLSTFSYPKLSVALTLFALSFVSLLLGYFVIFLVRPYITPALKRGSQYQINLRRLRRAQWWLIVVALAVVLINLEAYGLPPVFGFLGANTLSYIEYGKLKQVLNTAIMALFVSASFESSKRRKALMYTFSLLCMLAYATRGFLLVMLVQGMFVFSIRTTSKKRTLYAVAVGTMVAAALVSNFIGNGRATSSTAELLTAYFGIRETYATWPMTLLWVISYIAVPFSNMCWIVESYRHTGPTLTFLGTLLPAFWSPVPLEAGYLGNTYIIDGVHTYLAKYFLDLSYFGIFLINFVWGLISALLNLGNRLAANPLTSAVLLAAIAFIFFADYLTFLSIVMELVVLSFIQRYTVRWIRNAPAEIIRYGAGNQRA